MIGDIMSTMNNTVVAAMRGHMREFFKRQFPSFEEDSMENMQLWRDDAFNDVSARFTSTISSMLKKNCPEKAQEISIQFLSRYPLDYLAYSSLLSVFRKRGEFGAALDVCKFYLELLPAHPLLLREYADTLHALSLTKEDEYAFGLLDGARLFDPENQQVLSRLEQLKASLNVLQTPPLQPGAIQYVTNSFGYGEGGVNGVTQAKSMTLSSILMAMGPNVEAITEMRLTLPEALAEFAVHMQGISSGKGFPWPRWNATELDKLVARGPLNLLPSLIVVEGVRLNGHNYFKKLDADYKCPKIFVHHTSPDQFNSKYTDMDMLAEAVTALDEYDICVSVSQNVIGEWKALGNLGQKIWEYIPNCAREEEAEKILGREMKDVRAGLGIKEDAFVVLCLASVQPRKGQDVLLSQMNRLLEELPEAVFFFVGPVLEKWGGKKIQDYAEKNFDPERVQFLGPKKNALEYVYACDLFVLPSREEALPLTILEAMLFGKPCVASDVNGIPELVEHGETGLLFSHQHPEVLGEHIVNMAKRKNILEEFGVNARKRYLENFSRSVHIGNWHRVLSKYFR